MYLDILDLELMPEWVKTFGDVGVGWMCFVCEKGMSLKDQNISAMD